MSFHYSVCISSMLRRDLHRADVALLEWLFNSAGERPEIDPSDALRSAVLGQGWLRDWLCGGTGPAIASRVELSRRPDGAILSASLMLFSPGSKLEAVFDEWFQVLHWVASLIPLDGHFATVIREDGGEIEPFLFYSCGGRLFMKTDNSAVQLSSVNSDEQRTLTRR